MLFSVNQWFYRVLYKKILAQMGWHGTKRGNVWVTGACLSRHNPNTYKVYNVKSVIHKSFTDGAPYPLSNVNSIRGIYDFLELTVVPAVAAENMTELDARCTAECTVPHKPLCRRGAVLLHAASQPWALLQRRPQQKYTDDSGEDPPAASYAAGC